MRTEPDSGMGVQGSTSALQLPPQFPPQFPPDGNPYVGPHPFRTDQSHLFFGRDREARDLLALVIANRVVLLFAQSGAGKSSLINARLVPDLLAKNFEVLPVGRVSGESPDALRVENIFVFNLAAYLDEGEAGDERFAGVRLSDFLMNLIQEGGKWLYRPELAEAGEAPGASLISETGPAEVPEATETAETTDSLEVRPRILIVDQFEEIITSHPEAWEQRADFFRQIQQALTDDPYLWVLFAMREDYVAALSPYAHLLADGLRTRYYLQPMDATAALEAITRPAALYEHAFAPGVAELLVTNLRQLENRQARPDDKERANQDGGAGEPKLGQFVEPVQLQVVCRQLWASLDTPPGAPITTADLEKLAGGAGLAEFVNDALRVYYEQSLALALADHPGVVTERALRRWFDQVLITREGTRNLVYQSETDAGGMPNAVVAGLVNRFILRRETRGDRRWVELGHDRFVEPILRSNRDWFGREASPIRVAAEAWLAAGREPGKLYSGPQLAAAETLLRSDPDAWQPLEREFVEAGLREEQRRKEARSRNIRLLMTGAVVALLAVAAVMTYLYFSASSARDAAIQAQAKLEQSNADLTIARDAALEAQDKLEQSNADLTVARDAADAARREAEALRAAADEAKIAAEAAQGRAETSERSSRADNLAFKALDTLAEKPRLALLLAAESARIQLDAQEPVAPSVEQVMHAALEATGGRVIPLGPVAGQSVALSHDDRWLAVGDDQALRLWDLTAPVAAPSGPTDGPPGGPAADSLAGPPAGSRSGPPGGAGGSPRTFPGHEGGVWGISFLPNDGQLISLDGAGTIRLWSLTASAEPPTVLNPDGAQAWIMAVAPDGRRLAWAQPDGLLHLLDLEQTAEPPRTFGAAGQPSAGIAFSPDGDALASAGADGTVQLWNLAEAEPAAAIVARLDGESSAVAFAAEGGQIAVGDAGGRIHLVGAVGEGEPIVLTGPESRVKGLAFVDGPEGSRLLSAHEAGAVLLWDYLSPGSAPVELRGHEGTLAQLAVGAQKFATVASDQTVRVWDRQNLFYEPENLAHVQAAVSDLALAPDGARLLTVDDDGARARLWQTSDGAELGAFGRGGERVSTVGFGPASDLILTGSETGIVRVWSADGQEVRVLAGHTARINDIAVSGAGEVIATGSDDGTARLWALATGQALAVLAGHQAPVVAAAFSPDGRTLATASLDATVRLWDAATGQELHVLGSGTDYGFVGVSFSPDGARVAAAQDDGTIWQWHVENPQPLPPFSPFVRDVPVTALGYSPDRQYLASAHADGAVYLWPLRDPGAEPTRLTGHAGYASDLAFSPDGSALLTSGADGWVKRWTLPVAALVDKACQAAGRPLTPDEALQFLHRFGPPSPCGMPGTTGEVSPPP